MGEVFFFQSYFKCSAGKGPVLPPDELPWLELVQLAGLWGMQMLRIPANARISAKN